MQLTGLSFDTLPTIDLPFRFFASGALMLLFAALFISINSESIITNRWHPLLIMLVHGFTLGFISCVMIGALIQLLPVLTGIGLNNNASWIKIAFYSYLTATTALLVGFSYLSFTLTLILVAAYVVFLICLSKVLWPYIIKVKENISVKAVKVGIVALIIVVIMGLLLRLSYFGPGLATGGEFTDFHALLGLYGWIAMLIIGVSFQVIPMFFVTPAFPNWCRYNMTPIIVIALVLMAISLKVDWMAPIALFTLAISLIIYAIVTLVLLKKRKRKIFDASVALWQTGLTCLILSQLALLQSKVTLINIFGIDSLVLFAGLFLLGFVCSIIIAMLLKILPFLAYMHIQQIIFNNFALADKLPTMHQLLPKIYGKLLLTTQLINLVAMFYWLMASTDILVFSIPLLVQFSILFLAIFYVWRKHNTISIELHSANSIA